MEEKGLFDELFMSKAEAEKQLYAYTSGAKFHHCHPTEEPDGSIDLHGPEGQVLAKCYDAQCAMFLIMCMDLSSEYGMLKIEAEIVKTAMRKVKEDMDNKKSAAGSGSSDAPKGNPFDRLMGMLKGGCEKK